MRETFKSNVKYYKNNIDSKEFLEFLENSKKHQEEIRIKYDKKEYPDKTDYFDDDDVKLSKVFIYDTLTNKGISKLIKNLYKIKSKNKLYKVECNYRKPTLLKKYDYVQLQYTHSSRGTLGKIEFLQDEFISNIDISWTQINNCIAFIEYRIHFKKKFFDNKNNNDFILKNIGFLSRKDYRNWWRISKDDKSWNLDILRTMDDQYFDMICQHYITSLLFSEQGRQRKLINIKFYSRAKKIEIDKLFVNDFAQSFYHKKENYVLMRYPFDEDDYTIMTGSNMFNRFSFLDWASAYGNDFYYKFFAERELKKFEYEFSRYTTGRKSIKKGDTLLDLLNKLQSLSDITRSKDFVKAFCAEWEQYYKGKVKKLSKEDFFDTNEFQRIYQKNFDYFKMLTELQYTKSNKKLSITAILIALASIGVSILLKVL